jgi:hypothetical protein
LPEVRLRLSLALALAAAGCAELPPAPVAEPEAEAPSAVEPVAESPAFRQDTLKYLAGRHLKPQPTRPLNVRARCTHRDAIGTQTRLDLLVRDAQVRTFSARVAIKGRGSCHFELKDFEQVERLPQALLRHRLEKECSVRMWEQGHQVTLAFNRCPKSCEGQAFDYLWPVVVDARSGRCH